MIIYENVYKIQMHDYIFIHYHWYIKIKVKIQDQFDRPFANLMYITTETYLLQLYYYFVSCVSDNTKDNVLYMSLLEIMLTKIISWQLSIIFNIIVKSWRKFSCLLNNWSTWQERICWLFTTQNITYYARIGNHPFGNIISD